MSNRNQNPFENHIESNEFNINPLIDAGTNIPHHVLHPKFEEWLDEMPSSMTQGKWDDQLDSMQKRLRHSIAVEMIERGMFDEFSDQLEMIDDETLVVMMHYPITLALLSQDHFRRNGYPHDWESLEKADSDGDTIPSDASVFGIWRHWAGLIAHCFRTWLGRLSHAIIPRK